MSDLKEAEKTWGRLQAYPNILMKVQAILDLIEKGEVESADDFEEALIPEVRGFGREIVNTWAAHEEGLIREQLENDGTAHHSKKKSTGILPLAK